MIRRDFLRRLTATAAGLLVADDALEMLLEPRRKLWPGADFTGHASPMTQADIARLIHEIYVKEVVPFIVHQSPLTGPFGGNALPQGRSLIVPVTVRA